MFSRSRLPDLVDSRSLHDWPKRQVGIICRGRCELFIEESLPADLLNVAHEFGCWTEGGLFKKSYSVGRRRLCFDEMHSAE